MSAERARFPTYAEMQNPMFLHPSDGPSTIVVAEKLVGANNYRSWRRSMEINLATKRKLGFVKGTIERPTDDVQRADQWDTCNNLVIAWLMNSVSDSIAKSILYVESASAIWSQLEKRFSISNGSRKYRLDKEIYTMKQGGNPISEFYTRMQTVWEELDAMDVLPSLTNSSPEIVEFLKCIDRQKQEQKVFQLLNGLDDCYNAHRSQILLMTPLPNVEGVCSMIQQEESQKDGGDIGVSGEMSAMYSKSDEKCKVCGNKWHPKERCWALIGYPSWHYKSKKFPQKKETEKEESKPGKARGASSGGQKTAAQVMTSAAGEGNVVFTQKQFEELMRKLPGVQREARMDTTDDELEADFAGLCQKEAFGDW